MPTTKFYLHRTANAQSGTFPANTVENSANYAPLVTPGTSNGNATTPLLNNLVMDANIGVSAQTSLVYTTKAATTAQQQPFLRFVSVPLSAQTIAGQTITAQIGFACSNTASVFWWQWVLYAWRPSTGQMVGMIADASTSEAQGPATTSETNSSYLKTNSGGPNPVGSCSVNAGDVLVFEIWRSSQAQSMGTSYTNTVYYDGTTEGSASNNAAFIQFTNSVGLASDVSEPNNPISGAVDNFNDSTIDTGVWTTWGTGTQTESGTTLNHTPTGVSGDYVGITGIATYDLTNKAVTAQILQLPSSATGVQTYLRVDIDPNNGVIMGYGDGALFIQHQITGTTTNLNSQAWPAGCLALRINFDNAQNRVWFDTYSPATGWTNRYYETLPIATTALRSAIGSGCYQAVASPGTARWDAISTAPLRSVTGTSPGVTTVTALITRRRPLTAASNGVAVATGVISSRQVVYKNLIGRAAGNAQTTYYRQVLNSAPIAYWRLGETSGTSAADSSGRAHTGTYAATGVTLNQPSSMSGDANPSVVLAGATGASGLVNIPAHADWRPNGGGWSMEAWINPTALSGTHEIVRLGGADGWFLRHDGTLVTTLWGFAGGVMAQPSGGNIPSAGVWTHVVGTYDGAFIRHYINGVLAYSTAETRVFNPTNTGPVIIGAQADTGGEFFAGGLDEVAVYGYALDAATIAAHYAGRSITPTSILATRPKDIAGSSAGTSTENGQVNVRRLLGSGVSVGVASVAASISDKRRLLGVSTAVATVSATLNRKIAITGASAGAAVASGAITPPFGPKNITGLAAGVASVSATILRRRAIVALSAGVATDVGQPSAKRLLTVISNGKATTTGQPVRRKAMVGLSNGVASVTAQINRKISLVGAALGVAVADAFIDIRSATIARGQSFGVATVSGIIGRKRQIVAASVGIASVTAFLTRRRALTGASSGVAATTGVMSHKITLNPFTSSGAAITTGNIQRKRSLIGSSDGTSTTSTPAIQLKKRLVGSSAGSSVTNTAILSRTRVLTGFSIGRATVHGRVINIKLILWNGSTFTTGGNYPVVLWDQAEFQTDFTEGETLDYVAYRDSTDQFNPVEP